MSGQPYWPITITSTLASVACGIEWELDPETLRRTDRSRRAQYYRSAGDTSNATRMPPGKRVACEFRGRAA